MCRWMRVVPGLIAVACLVRGSPALPCSLCGSGKSQQTLRLDFEQAQAVVYATAANPRFGPAGRAPGSGVTDFHILRVLKDHPLLAGRKVIEVPRYIPVLDPRDPPKFVVFCDIAGGKLDPSRGRPVTSAAVLDYLEGARALAGQDRTRALQYYFRFLDHPDPGLAADAFLEFARSTDLEIGAVAKHLSPAPLRKLLANPATPRERIGMVAFLLGACGGPQDADALRKLVDQPGERTTGALDGILGGYIQLRPRQGWDLAVAIVKDPRRSFEERFAVARTLRFYHGWQPAESRQEVVRALGVMVEEGEVADLAIEDLRRWQIWDLTGRIVAQYGKPSHSAPIVRSAIVRYALSCPQPEVRPFIDRVRRQDAELVRDLEESLERERQK